MNVSYSLHYLLALWSLILGVAAGFLYEFFRLLHRLHPRMHLLIFFEDLLFCMLCTCGMSLLFFNLSYGRMRLYAFAGAALGFLLWYVTAGKLFRKMLSLFVSRLKPPLAFATAWKNTCVQSALFAHKAKKGFGCLTFFRRNKDA